MARIEVFADIVCPFTHVGLHRLVEARAARDASATIVVRAWPLERINGSPLDPELVASEITALRTQVARDLFRGFDASHFPKTSIPAFGLVAAAYAHDSALGESVSIAVRNAVFEHGLDVGDERVIKRMAETFGIEPFTAEQIEEAVAADWADGRARGVRGSPHFFVGDFEWFCPTLRVRHANGAFDVHDAEASTREFYAVAFG
jgi:predicted DsbA family dithiol-disulfide isomerase